jgi:hypothetical protein
MSVLSQIEIPKGKHVLRILDNTGDTVLTYDPAIDTEVENAMAKFDESMAKGMKAFVLETEGGGEGYATQTLDPQTAVHTVVSPQYVGG